jgi:4a-hydroxytetrahydrobiopterin dehydratase
MQMIERLDEAALRHAALLLPDWKVDVSGDDMARNFTFRDFTSAFAFMMQVAVVAEDLDHHPEWSNVYNRVSIRLTTHDAGGLSARDIFMAQRIDAIAQNTELL